MQHSTPEAGAGFYRRDHGLSGKDLVLLGISLGAFGLLLVVSLGLTHSLIDLVPQALVALALLGTAVLSLRAAFPSESSVGLGQTTATLSRTREMNVHTVGSRPA